jgi:GNAT superfamily N-acetyltransferase
MKIDIAVPADADALAQLVNAAYRGSSGRVGWTAEASLISGARVRTADVSAMINDEATTILVARDARASDTGASSLSGCVAIEADDESCMLSMLAVDPDLQSGQIGRTLLESAERFASQNGARIAKMTVIRQRDTLIAWYERRGYRPTGAIEPFPYGDDSVGTPLRDDLQFVVLQKTMVAGP